MTPARLSELLEPFLDRAIGQRLTGNDLEHISTYIDILLRWNARINLTAIRDPEEVVTRHFGESLFAARHLFPDAGRQAVTEKNSPASSAVKALDLADIGSGAGFPGIPIKLWAPHLSVTLIESNHKKATFLREVTRALTLTDINIQTVRAETVTTRFATVTLRAVERFAAILPIAASLVAPAGRLALLIGSTQLPQVHACLPHFSWPDPIPVPQSQSRVLLISRRHN